MGKAAAKVAGQGEGWRDGEEGVDRKEGGH